MPPKKVNEKAAKYCGMINDDSAAFVELSVRRMSVQFDDAELGMLAKAGYDKTDGDYSVHKDGVVITKAEVEAGTTVYVVLAGGPKIKAYPTLSELTRPAHVEDFLAELDQVVRGASPEKWGKSGEDGLMYRGHNLFDIYVSKAFNELLENVIKNDEETRVREKCEKCKMSFTDRSHENTCRDMVRLLEECSMKNLIPPDDITCQEVYLGYVPAQDTFMTAWDVFGSDSTGCVIIEFKIDEFGKVRNSRDDHEYREPGEICDAGRLKFYAKPDCSPSLYGPHVGRSMYECVSGTSREDWKIIDIRLD